MLIRFFSSRLQGNARRLFLVVSGLVLMSSFGVTVLSPAPAYAAASDYVAALDPAMSKDCPKDHKKDCDFIGQYINPGIKLFTAAFGIIAVISIIVGGIQYATSTDDPQKVSRAKQRIINTVIAIVAYFFLYAFLQFLIPGGVFRS